MHSSSIKNNEESQKFASTDSSTRSSEHQYSSDYWLGIPEMQ